MPYSKNTELPSEVKKKYSGHQQTVFRKAFNNALKEYGDESKAFAVAHAAAQRVSASVELVLGSIQFEADADPRFLRFHDAVLARAETNSNHDHIDEDGVHELASTITGTPIDLEHDPRKNIGFYTAGKADSGALKVDGIVWLDRCEALGVNPEEIESGKYRLSIEAEAQIARCSVCNTTHESIASYCKHLKNKAVYGATRFLNGLRARGGAITKAPAGSETTFSTMMFIASHQEQPIEEVDVENELTASEIEAVEMWINAVVSAIEKREDVSPADKKRAEKEYGDVEYADEKNKKYPLDKEHIHAAWSYINMPKNASKYSPEELKTIKSKIKRAAKKYGMEIADEKEKSKSESSKETIMADEDKKKEEAETPEEEKKESPEEEKKEKENDTEAKANMDVEYKKMKSDMDKMCAELEAGKAKITKLEAELKASREVSLKAQLVGSIMEEADFETDKERLLKLDAADIALLIKAATKRESTAGKKPENRILASEKAPDNGRVKIVLRRTV